MYNLDIEGKNTSKTF